LNVVFEYNTRAD